MLLNPKSIVSASSPSPSSTIVTLKVSFVSPGTKVSDAVENV